MKLINKKIVMTRDIGIHGNLFGGIMMAWIDEAAAAYATEYCFTPNMVTVRVGELIFRKPLKSGNHLRIYGEVTDIRKTSIRLNIEARKYSVYSSEETVVCTTSIVFVRIDDDGTPTPIAESVRTRFRLESGARSLEPRIRTTTTSQINSEFKMQNAEFDLKIEN